MSDNTVILGRLTRPHSIRGEIRVDYYADSLELLDGPLLLRAGRSEVRPVRVASRRLWKEQLIIRLEGVEDRSTAETLRGQELLVDKSLLPEANPDEPYLDDLLGLPIELENGVHLGILDEVLFPAGQEVWSIRTPGDREVLLPAVPEFVRDIDLDNGRIVVAPPPGLLEIYAPDPPQEKTAPGGPIPVPPDDGV